MAQELAGGSLGDSMQEATFGVLYTLSKEKFAEGWRWVLITMVRRLAGRGRGAAGRRRSSDVGGVVPSSPNHPSLPHTPTCVQVVDYLQIAMYFIGSRWARGWVPCPRGRVWDL